MAFQTQKSDRRIALILWRNVFAALLILVLIVARQAIIQTNLQKSTDATTLVSSALRQMQLCQRLETSAWIISGNADFPEKSAAVTTAKNDLIQWDSLHQKYQEYVASAKAGGLLSADDEEKLHNSDVLYSQIQSSVGEILALYDRSADKSLYSAYLGTLHTDTGNYSTTTGELASVFESETAKENAQTNLLELVLFYVLIIAVLLQITFIFLPGQRRLYSSFEEVRFLRDHDRLTELLNPYTFVQRIEEESAKTQKGDVRLCLLILDVDDFMRLTEKFGRQVADEILRRIARKVRSVLRENDFAARLQNDTFAFMIRENNNEVIKGLAEQLISAIADEQISSVGRISSCIGIAFYQGSEQPIDWMNRAQIALIQAKSEGKNRVVCESLIRSRDIPVSVQWSSQWESGNGELDGQHRLLLQIGNQLLALSVTGKDTAEESLVLQQFMKELMNHFVFEEKLMRDLEYEDAVNHAKIHERLLKKAQDMLDDFAAGNLTSGYVFSFLVEEIIIGHIQEEDTKFFPVLRSHPIRQEAKKDAGS